MSRQRRWWETLRTNGRLVGCSPELDERVQSLRPRYESGEASVELHFDTVYMVLALAAIGRPSIVTTEVRNVAEVKQFDSFTTVEGRPVWSIATAVAGAVLGVLLSPWFFIATVLIFHKAPLKAKAPGYAVKLVDGRTFTVVRKQPWGAREIRHIDD